LTGKCYNHEALIVVGLRCLPRPARRPSRTAGPLPWPGKPTVASSTRRATTS